MNEITKLYENARIKPTKNWQSCLNCKLKTETRYDEWGEEYLTCDRLERPEECSDAKEYYPIFTAEKQLAVFKMLCIRYLEVSQHIEENGDLCFGIKATVGDYATAFDKDFAECLASFVNQLWHSLTPEQKQQVKGILK